MAVMCSTPNVILPFFGGILVDKIGTRTTLVAFNVLLCGAAALVSFGLSIESIWVMVSVLDVLGRVYHMLFLCKSK